MTARSSGGDALVGQLEREGVRHVFGVPGQQLDHAMDALARSNGRIAFIANRHEQGSAYMADGYARASGEVGVCMVVPGPGLLNAMAGLATAHSCSSPVLCIVGQIPSALIGRGMGVLHEIPNQSRLLDSVTKWHALARSPEEVPGLVREAFRQLRSGRPQPVAIEIPPDVLAAEAAVALVAPPAGEDGRTRPAPAAVEAAARLLAEARRPAIFVGGGVQTANASAELEAVADALQAPVIMTRSGRGSLSDRHPLALTRLSGRKVLADADLLLVVGSRFVGFGGKPVAVAEGAKVVMVDADPASLGEPRAPHLAITADAKLFLAALGQALASGPPKSGANEPWGADVAAAAKAWVEEKLAPIEPQMSYLRALRAALPDDGVLVTDLTQVAYPARVGFPFHAPRTNLTSGYQGTLGFGFPVALGAKVARPERAAVALTGDGGFLWCVQELATARQYDIGAIAVVFNDNSYGNVRRTQQDQFAGRMLGTELRNPDFVALAQSFGVAARKVGSPEALEDALRDAIADNAPTVIEAPIGDVPSPWHLIG
jgi:acetolactate synthase-1/2/3 large subunit